MSQALVPLKRRSARKTTSEKERPEAALNFCISLDGIGYIEDATSDAEQFLQRSRDSLLNTPFAGLVCEESRRVWLAHFLSHRRHGKRGKARLLLSIGKSKRAVEAFTETFASLGTLRFIVTLQESSWTALDGRSSRGMLSDLISNIYDLVITVDRRGKVGFTNQPILERLPDQVIGTSFYDYVRPYDLKRFRLAIDQAFGSGTSTDFINSGLVCFPSDKHFRVRVKPLPIKRNVKAPRRAIKTEMVLIVFADITDQQRAEKQLDRMHYNRQRVARRAILIREEERRRLALELHDQFGQILTTLKIDLWLAGKSSNTKQKTRSAIKSAETAVDQLINLVRELSAELRPPLIDDLGLVSALQFQMETFQNRTGIRGVFRTRTEDVSTSSEIAMGVFRVFQEILTNIIRHSRATKVEVGLEVHRGWLFLNVSDNGRGIKEEELSSPNSLGLIGMHERAQQLGGAIHIQNGSTEGTIVAMQVPLSARRGRGRVREQR